MNPDELKTKKKTTSKSGVVVITAFKTSDGTVYENHKLAKTHEADYNLHVDLRRIFDQNSNRDFVIEDIMDNKTALAAALAAWKRRK